MRTHGLGTLPPCRGACGMVAGAGFWFWFWTRTGRWTRAGVRLLGCVRSQGERGVSATVAPGGVKPAFGKGGRSLRYPHNLDAGTTRTGSAGFPAGCARRGLDAPGARSAARLPCGATVDRPPRSERYRDPASNAVGAASSRADGGPAGKPALPVALPPRSNNQRLVLQADNLGIPQG
jgi:hypothetical protein